jgi:hypothetical protein
MLREWLTLLRTYLPGTSVTDPSEPPRPPAYTLIWMVVAALLAVLSIAVLRGWHRWLRWEPLGCPRTEPVLGGRYGGSGGRIGRYASY